MSHDHEEEHVSTFDQLPLLHVSGEWTAVLHGKEKQEFEHLLPQFLMNRRWFGGKGRKIASATIAELVPIPHDETVSFLALIEVKYTGSPNDTYLLGLSFIADQDAEEVLKSDHNAALLRVVSSGTKGVIYDAVRDRGFVMALLDSIDRESKFTSTEGEVSSSRTEKFREFRSQMKQGVSPRLMGAEQSNTSIVFGERLIMKLFRRVESGVNPDFEIGRFLTEHGFFNTPPVAGAIEMSPVNDDEEPRTLSVLHGFVPNEGDAWKYTLESLRRSLQEVHGHMSEVLALQLPDKHILELADDDPPAIIKELAGDYFESARLLGKRTAEMHVTLDSDGTQSGFTPEEFSPDYQRSVHNSMRRLAGGVLEMLRENLNVLPKKTQEHANLLLSREDEITQVYHPILEKVFDAERTRIHGDYHLGQVLYTGADFVIIDFEGEPLRSIRERRIKRSPLRDVAGMLRSFDYAGHTAVMHANVPEQECAEFERFARAWVAWVSAAFLSSYIETAKHARFMPADSQDTATMLDLFLTDKAIYEIGYELNNRPTWASIPINGILQILDQHAWQRDAKQRRAA